MSLVPISGEKTDDLVILPPLLEVHRFGIPPKSVYQLIRVLPRQWPQKLNNWPSYFLWIGMTYVFLFSLFKGFQVFMFGKLIATNVLDHGLIWDRSKIEFWPSPTKKNLTTWFFLKFVSRHNLMCSIHWWLKINNNLPLFRL